MESYQIEQQIVEQNDLWKELREFVENQAGKREAHEVEEDLFKYLLKMGKSLLSEVFARFNAETREKRAVDDGTGMSLPRHGMNSRKYQSIFGIVNISRVYYWKPGCEGIYLLDAHFNLPQRCYSHLLAKWTLDGVAEEPYEEAIERIHKIFGINLSKRGQEELAQEVTQDVEQFYQEKAHITSSIEGSILIATADCKGVTMVPAERTEQTNSMKEEGVIARAGRGRKGLKRDAVVTADYSFNPEVRTSEEMIDLLMRSHTTEERAIKKEEEKKSRANGEKKPREPRNKRVMASLKGKATAFRDLADRLSMRDATEKKPIFIQVDGDASLEKGLLNEFKNRGWEDRIAGVGLDIIHVMEYVWEASTALNGERSKERVEWVRKQGLALLRGKVGYVIGGLKQILKKREKVLRQTQKKVLEKVIRYFTNHRHMMRYNEYLAKGFPIATGVIEGACGSLVKDRTDRSGMKWTHNGAQAVLHLRALKRNGDWEDYWDEFVSHERERQYGDFDVMVA